MHIGMSLCVACGAARQKHSFFLNQRFDSDFFANFCHETNDFLSLQSSSQQSSIHVITFYTGSSFH